VPELSARRVVTSELATGARFSEVLDWPQQERDLAGETLYRFVFRSLYEIRAFNGDPHPGNYLFHGDGKVTFLDFGMVKHFTDTDILPLMEMARTLCVAGEPGEFRASLEEAGFLVPGAPLTDDQIVDHLAVFYQLVRDNETVTVTGEYASSVVRRFFDVRSPVAQWARIPRSYVILQRINLGLFALLGEMKATANWRAIAEEIWPFMLAPPSTPMGAAELPWLDARPAVARSLAQ
jgi:predicted unusual protein kinase regulating ubiquinone biosynthesis (AarF/ABC1/UbiB family)